MRNIYLAEAELAEYHPKPLISQGRVRWLELKSVTGIVIGSLLAFLIGKLALAYTGGITLFLGYGIVILAVYLLVFISAFYQYKDPARDGRPLSEMTDEELPLVTCMVAVRDEELFIGECLDSLFDQTYQKYEVIVVNDASTDNTQAVLESYRDQKQPSLKIISLERNVGKKTALCIAMQYARGSLFAHTDSDSVWDRHALGRCVRIMVNHPDVGAISGHGRARNTANFITRVQDAWMDGQFSVRKAFESSYGSVTCVSGPLAVYRKEAVYNVLPAWAHDTFMGAEFRFATDRTLTAFVLGAPWLQDELSARHARSAFLRTKYPVREWKVVYSRSARSQTIVPDTFKKMLRQQIRWKKSFIRNAVFNWPFFWRKPFPVALVFYAHILFVLLAPFIAVHVFLTPKALYIETIVAYLLGAFLMGGLFALVLRAYDKECEHWYYRPFMSIFSAVVLCWIIIYSTLTIRKMKWYRG